jgi:hypothetical protein
LSVDPTVFPGRTDRTIPVTRIPGGTDFERTSDNRVAVEALLGYTQLPAPTVVARPDVVFVTVADVNDLERWLSCLGGVIHVSEAAIEGLQLWTLHTQTPERRGGSRVAIRVSAVVVVGQAVLSEVKRAVA